MKETKEYYKDWRLRDICAYCGGFATTEDHVPSRCFLDKPHPDSPPVVPCCKECNNSFSLDEEYVSCYIDCVKEGTTDITCIQREKTAKTLKHSPALLNEISTSIDFSSRAFRYDSYRFERVMWKLAYGHLAFMHDQLSFEEKCSLNIRWFSEMEAEEKRIFERGYFMKNIAPSVGTRFQDNCGIVFVDNRPLGTVSLWTEVQKGRYRYCVSPTGDAVKFVIAETLAVEACLVDD